MSDITNNEEITEVVEESPVVEAVVVDAAENPVVQTPVVEAPERKGPVIQTPVVKGTKAAVVENDGSRPNPRKVREGIVVSDKMDMTLVVAVNERVSHPRYGKTVQRTKKLYVHDENNDAKVGDRVRVQETRPVSKLKRWRLTEVVERAR
jgi:small subunit ribosomal protein S17